MRHLPSLKHLQYFIAIVENGSFTKAATECHVTQSTLSAGLASLENMLGHQLIDRNYRQIVLTPFGEDMAVRARQILMQAEDILDRARQIDTPLSGPLRLGLIPTIAPYLLPLILPALRAHYPKLELQIHEDLSERLVAGLKTGALDLVLMAFPYESTGLTEHELFDEAFVLASPHGALPDQARVKISDLDGDQLLLLEEGHCLRDHALAACKIKPRKDRQGFNATSLHTLIEMVRHGYGMTLLPAMAADSLGAPGDIDLHPFENPPPIRKIGMAWRKDHVREEEFRLLGALIKPFFTEC